jgi:hypothetical protein
VGHSSSIEQKINKFIKENKHTYTWEKNTIVVRQLFKTKKDDCRDDETRLGASQDTALSRNYHRRTSKYAAVLLSVATCKLMATVHKIKCERTDERPIHCAHKGLPNMYNTCNCGQANMHLRTIRCNIKMSSTLEHGKMKDWC